MENYLSCLVSYSDSQVIAKEKEIVEGVLRAHDSPISLISKEASSFYLSVVLEEAPTEEDVKVFRGAVHRAVTKQFISFDAQNPLLDGIAPISNNSFRQRCEDGFLTNCPCIAVEAMMNRRFADVPSTKIYSAARVAAKALIKKPATPHWTTLLEYSLKDVNLSGVFTTSQFSNLIDGIVGNKELGIKGDGDRTITCNKYSMEQFECPLRGTNHAQDRGKNASGSDEAVFDSLPIDYVTYQYLKGCEDSLKTEGILGIRISINSVVLKFKEGSELRSKKFFLDKLANYRGLTQVRESLDNYKDTTWSKFVNYLIALAGEEFVPIYESDATSKIRRYGDILRQFIKTRFVGSDIGKLSEYSYLVEYKSGYCFAVDSFVLYLTERRYVGEDFLPMFYRWFGLGTAVIEANNALFRVYTISKTNYEKLCAGQSDIVTEES